MEIEKKRFVSCPVGSQDYGRSGDCKFLTFFSNPKNLKIEKKKKFTVGVNIILSPGRSIGNIFSLNVGLIKRLRVRE